MYSAYRFVMLIFFSGQICGTYSQKESSDELNFIAYLNGSDDGAVVRYSVSTKHDPPYISRKGLNTSLPISQIVKSVTDIAVLPDRNQIYLIDPYIGWILYIQIKQDSFQGNIMRFIEGISPGISKIAIDVDAENIYWTDSLFGWIAMSPARTSNSNNNDVGYHVMVDNLRNIDSLAVDSVNSLIFWSSSEILPKIERIEMSRKNRDLVAIRGIGRAVSLTVDELDQRLFWFDTAREQIESSQYDGSDRKLIVAETGVSLALFLSEKLLIFKQGDFDVVEHKENTFEVFTDKRLVSVSAWTRKQTPKKDHCRAKRCSHYCEYKENIANCRCFEGYILHQDGISCLGVSGYSHRLFVYAVNNSLCTMDIIAVTGFERNKKCFNLPSGEITHIAADMRIREIYAATKENGGRIYRCSLLNENTRIFLESVGSIGGLKFDPYEKSVLWTEKTSGKIYRANVSNSKRDVLFSDLQSPSNLVLNVKSREMYWINDMANQIVSATMDRKNYKVLIVSESPKALALDENANRLYWTTDNKVLSLDIHGGSSSEYKELSTNGLQFLMFYRNFLIYMQIQGDEGGKQHSVFLKTKSSSSSRNISSLKIDERSKVTDILIIDENMHSQASDKCSESDGGCDHYCYSNMEDSMCLCEFGYMTVNGTCKTEMSSNECIIITDNVSRKIYQYDLKTGEINSFDVEIHSRPVDAVLLYSDIFWIEHGSRELFSYPQISVPIIIPESYIPIKLANNFQTRNIYIVALNSTIASGQIVSVSTITFDVQLIYRGNIILDIAVNSLRSEIFALEKTENTTSIISVHLGSLFNKTIFQIGNGNYASITVDIKTDTVYWTDTDEGSISIYRMFSSQSPRKLFSHEKARLGSIRIYEENLYCIVKNKKEIVKLDKTTGVMKGAVVHSPLFGDLSNLFIFANVICSMNVTNGTIEGYCAGKAGSRCNISCDAGFSSKAIKHLTCLDTGKWNTDINKICQEEKGAIYLIQKETDHIGLIIAISLCVIIIAAVVIGSVIMYKRCLKIRVKRLEQKKEEDNETVRPLVPARPPAQSPVIVYKRENQELRLKNIDLEKQLIHLEREHTRTMNKYKAKISENEAMISKYESKYKSDIEEMQTEISDLRAQLQSKSEENELLIHYSPLSSAEKTTAPKTLRSDPEQYDYTEDTHTLREIPVAQSPPPVPERDYDLTGLKNVQEENCSDVDDHRVIEVEMYDDINNAEINDEP